MFHPKEICSEEKCLDKECMKRHIRDCTQWAKGTCKFQSSCAYKHDPNKIIKESEPETILNTEKLNDSDYIDYDNLDLSLIHI